jgi:hypothetical protein
VLAVLSASLAAGYLLLPNPLADVFFAAWVLVGVGLAGVGGVAVWTNRTPLAWVAALLLTGLSVAGLWSVGLLVSPAALCLLGSVLLRQSAGPQTEPQDAVISETPTVPEAVLTTLVGTVSLIAGVGLVYVGAVTRVTVRRVREGDVGLRYRRGALGRRRSHAPRTDRG